MLLLCKRELIHYIFASLSTITTRPGELLKPPCMQLHDGMHAWRKMGQHWCWTALLAHYRTVHMLMTLDQTLLSQITSVYISVATFQSCRRHAI